jgi:hypothetical protein
MGHRDLLKTARKIVFDTMAYPATVTVAVGVTVDVNVKWNRQNAAVGELAGGYGEVFMARDRLVFWLDGLPSTVGERGQVVQLDGGDEFQLLECETKDEFTQTWEANRG